MRAVVTCYIRSRLSSADLLCLLLEDALVVSRHHLDELSEAICPVGEHCRCHWGVSKCEVIFNHLTQFGDIRIRFYRVEIDHLTIAVVRKVLLRIPDVSDTATHASRKIAPSSTQYYHAATGHVFAAMITNAFDNGFCTTVANTKSFRRNAAKIGITRRRSIQGNIAKQNILFRCELAVLGRIYDHPATGQPFADKVIGITFHLEGNALG